MRMRVKRRRGMGHVNWGANVDPGGEVFNTDTDTNPGGGDVFNTDVGAPGPKQDWAGTLKSFFNIFGGNQQAQPVQQGGTDFLPFVLIGGVAVAAYLILKK